MRTQKTDAHNNEFQAVPSSAYVQHRVYTPLGVSVCFGECMRAQKTNAHATEFQSVLALVTRSTVQTSVY